MARVTASEARRQFFRLLDAAERGEDVVLERKGVRFRLVVVEDDTEARPAESPIAVTDARVLSGEWHWDLDSEGNLIFAADEPDMSEASG
jgi:prevent-host-death family protein